MKKIQQKIRKGIVFLLLVILSGCGNSVKKISEEKFLFGTYINIIIYSNNETKAKESIELAFKKIEEIDEKYNSKNSKSVIYKINNEKNKEIEIDSELKNILNSIRKIYVESGKKYDITISPLLDLWGFGKNPRDEVPKKLEIKEVLKFINFSDVVVEKNNLKYLNNVKKIDTGSFLKGYAIEKAKNLLEKRGEEHAFITSISSIATIGKKLENKPWRVGIQDPFNSEKTLGIVELSGNSLGVSGDYQTYVEINGKKYHHLMDKQTGYPIDDKKLVAVISKSAFLADMYSTALFSMSEQEIFKFAEKNQIEVLIVKSNGERITTKNFILK